MLPIVLWLAATWQAPVRVPMAGAPSVVAAADLDGDGAADLIVGCERALAVARNNGRGGFRETLRLSLPRTPSELAVADFNGDGKMDVAAADHDTYAIVIFHGDGRGNLTRAETRRAKLSGRPHIHGLLAADLNRDDRPELLLSSVDEGELLQPGRAGTRVGSSQNPIVFDANRDGIPDIAIPMLHHRRVGIWLGDGKGGLTAQPEVRVRDRPYAAAAGDWNRDGAMDLVISHDDVAEVTLLAGDGRGGFRVAATPSFPSGVYRVGMVDADGDGALDLVGAGARSVLVLRQGAASRFEAGAPLLDGMAAWMLTVADLNGDGVADLIAPRPREGEVNVLLSGAAKSGRSIP